MKKLMITISALAAVAALADGDPGVEDSWQQADREAKWELVNLEVPGLNGDITAYRTDAGTIRLESLKGVIQAQAKIDSAEFAKYRDLNQYLSNCASTEKAYPAYRKLPLIYTLRIKIFPARHSGLSYIAHGKSRDQVVTSLDTVFSDPRVYEVHLETAARAMTSHTLEQGVSGYERVLSGQIFEQKNVYSRQGEVTIDLSRHEDVVCDILSGNLKVNVVAQTWYSRAKLDHTTRIFSDQMRDLYADVKGKWRAKKTLERNIFFAGVQLGKSAAQLRLRTDLNDEELARLHDLLWEPVTGQLRDFSNDDLTAVAAKMDILKPGSSMSQPTYSAVVQSPFQGGLQ